MVASGQRTLSETNVVSHREVIYARTMRTERKPQTVGTKILASGNIAIVDPVIITDPAHLPLGGDAEPGEWGEVVGISVDGETLSMDFTDQAREARGDFRLLVLDPPAFDVTPNLVDVEHLDHQYTAA